MTAPDTLELTAGDLRSQRRHRAWRRPRLPRYTIRLRLAVLYSGVFLILGTLLLALIFLSVRHSSHGVVASAQGAVAKLVERHSVQVAPSGSTLSVVPESLANQRERAQDHHLGAVALSVNSSDLHQLLIWSVFALAIMAVASIALGWLLAGRVLRPLQTITTAARKLSATNLHERLALDGPHDELRELGDTFDELLGRLEASFEAQRRFVANASHELRTPLTVERAILEVTLADPSADVGTLRAACERVLAIGGQQERMIDALLTLARSERALERREPLHLQSVLGAALRDRREELERHGLRLETELADAPITGDSRLIERLATNLIDNAIRHNTTGGWVTATTTVEDGRAVLHVANSGPAIAPEELEQLTRPFHRLAGRTGHGDGHGLGLSIIDAIATAHGATLAFHSQPTGGLHVEVRFPAADASVS
jgi:signal transduction histidine kinase